MARFQMEEAGMSAAGTALQRLRTRMEYLTAALGDCRAGLGGSSGMREIRRTLAGLMEELTEETAGIGRLGEALAYAQGQYVRCERENLRCIGQADRRCQEASAGADKREPLERLWDTLSGQERELAYIATTEEQMEAADQRMQEEIRKLKGAERYTEEAWARASVEERKALLQDYMNEAAAVLGVPVKKEIEYFYREPNQRGILTNGSYKEWGEKLSLNAYVIEALPPADSYYLLSTVIHELRHAYQHEALDNPTDYQVDKETLEDWEENLDHYVDSSGGYENYRQQLVEADARVFAGQKKS